MRIEFDAVAGRFAVAIGSDAGFLTASARGTIY